MANVIKITSTGGGHTLRGYIGQGSFGAPHGDIHQQRLETARYNFIFEIQRLLSFGVQSRDD
jgi:hypothetical protein